MMHNASPYKRREWKTHLPGDDKNNKLPSAGLVMRCECKRGQSMQVSVLHNEATQYSAPVKPFAQARRSHASARNNRRSCCSWEDGRGAPVAHWPKRLSSPRATGSAPRRDRKQPRRGARRARSVSGAASATPCVRRTAFWASAFRRRGQIWEVPVKTRGWQECPSQPTPGVYTGANSGARALG